MRRAAGLNWLSTPCWVVLHRFGGRRAGRVCESVSEFVGVLREDGRRVACRSRTRKPPTQAAFRWSLPLPLTLTRADLRWPGITRHQTRRHHEFARRCATLAAKEEVVPLYEYVCRKCSKQFEALIFGAEVPA